MEQARVEAAASDEALALRVAGGGDPAAEAELVQRLAPRVRLYGLRHLRDAAAADDLVQEALLLTLERLRAGRVRQPERLASFVFGACRLLVRNQRRGTRRRDALLERFAGELERQAVPEPLRLDEPKLRDCLARLAERERSVARADVLRRSARRRDRGAARPEPRQRADCPPPGPRPAAALRGRRRRVISLLEPARGRSGPRLVDRRARRRRGPSRGAAPALLRLLLGPGGALPAVAEGVRGLVREGRLPAVLCRSSWSGCSSRDGGSASIGVAPGGGVQCTVRPEDDVVLARLSAASRASRGSTWCHE